MSMVTLVYEWKVVLICNIYVFLPGLTLTPNLALVTQKSIEENLFRIKIGTTFWRVSSRSVNTSKLHKVSMVY